MTIHVVIREDQSEHGFIDSGIVGVFRHYGDADSFVKSSTRDAREQGLRVCGDPGTEPDWDVSWAIEQHLLA